MILNPKIGKPYKIWYNKKAAEFMPYHGRIGIVKVRGNGKPRNHVIQLLETSIVIPCGNIIKVKT
jgi:hypothetical protein